LVRYPEPIVALPLPLVDGARYAVTAAIDGTVSGLPFVGSDDVTVEVVGSGVLDLPYVRFSPVLRVRSTVARRPSVGAPVITRRATSFVFECFGEVARAEARVDETDPDFTVAASLRRFALGARP
jgi:hypothetical protein